MEFLPDGAVVIRNKQDLNLCLSRPRLETCCTFLLESVCENQPSEFPPFRSRAEKPHTWPSKHSSWATVLAVAGMNLKAAVCGANLLRPAEGRDGLVWIIKNAGGLVASLHMRVYS